MRSEEEMLELILNVAKNDERIRAVLLTGSRANPSAPRDAYQDYDITYFVKDVTPFYHNLDWIEEHFGKPAVLQMPEIMTHPSLPPDGDGHFTYLMLFEDGNRIDLNFEFRPFTHTGEPAVILLDKDGALPPLPAPSDAIWHIKPPSQKIFQDCCNEFWWCLNNVGKGIARDELPYVMEMFNRCVRDMLNQMVEWYIGIQTDFAVSAGKMGKYYKRYLAPDIYALYAETYSDSEYEHVWAAIFAACELFRLLAQAVAVVFGYGYNRQEDAAMMAYLTGIRQGNVQFGQGEGKERKDADTDRISGS